MRSAIVSAVAGLLGATAWASVSFGQAWSVAPPASPPTRVWVHLNGPADLEQLRSTNLNHYRRAQPILAAANEICQPGPTHAYPTRFEGDYLNCESMIWLTSYPPQKRLVFHLDDVGYIALVSVTVGGAKVEKLAAKAATAK
jgi:hypothetical protein